MNAELVSIGTEILLGEITDTNATHIARALRDIGVNIYFFTAVGDNLERITTTLKNGLKRSDLIITTGGLGPTVDDMTRQAVAAATGRELVFHQHLLDIIAERFKMFGVKMTENNRQQAMIPAEALIIENPVGTAPCFIVESEDRTIISLPGVPREMKYLLENAVLPYLRRRMGLPAIIKARVLHCTGIGESMLDEKIADLMMMSNPTVGLAAHSGQIDIRITARAETEAEADAMIAPVEQEVRARAGKYIYGTDMVSLDETVIGTLKKRGMQIALLEAGTGGVIAERMRKAADSATILRAAEQYPDLDDLRARFKVEDITELAKTSASVLREDMAVPVALAILNDHGKTTLAISTPDQFWSRSMDMGSDSDLVIWAGNWGLGYIWRYLNNGD